MRNFKLIGLLAFGLISLLAWQVQAKEMTVLGVKEGSDLTVECQNPVTKTIAPTKDDDWEKGLDVSGHDDIQAYRVKLDNGQWSDWYVPGINDIDWQKNADGSQRRLWARFTDYTHEIIVCDDDSNKPENDNDLDDDSTKPSDDSLNHGSQCTSVIAKPTMDKYWENLHLDVSAHPEIIKYRIRWWSGEWSQWYTTGVDDLDAKVNTDGTARRMWSYFTDHVHEYVKCATSTTKPDVKPVEKPTTKPTDKPTESGQALNQPEYYYYDKSIYESPIVDFSPYWPILPGDVKGYVVLRKNIPAKYRAIGESSWQTSTVKPTRASDALQACQTHFPGSYVALSMDNRSYKPAWYKYIGTRENGRWLTFACMTPPTNGLGAMPTSKDLGAISYFYGKVNKYYTPVNTSNNADAAWTTDPDGVSGANIDAVKYCQKWYPATKSAEFIGNTIIGNWATRSFGAYYDAGGQTFACRATEAASIKTFEDDEQVKPEEEKPEIKPEEKPSIKPTPSLKTTESLIKAKNGGVYLVDKEKKVKKPIVDQKILEINYADVKIENKPEILEELKDEAPVKLADGTLVKTVENPQVYIIAEGKRHWIKDEETFKSLGYDFKDVQTVNQRVVQLQPVSTPVELPAE